MPRLNPSQFTLYNAKTGERLRTARGQEPDHYYLVKSRNEPGWPGDEFGMDAQTEVWVDVTRAETQVLAWIEDVPILRGYHYAAQVTHPDQSLELIDVEAEAAARFSKTRKNKEGTASATFFGYPKCRIQVFVDPEDAGLPPEPVLNTWRSERRDDGTDLLSKRSKTNG